MKVILTENVKSLGLVGELVNVSPGHARNYLIPNNQAKLADEGNSKQMADYQKMLDKKVQEEKAAAQAIADKLNGLTLNLVKKVGSNGRLFGTVTNTELSKELAQKDIEVERRLLIIEKPIKTTGEYEIKAKLFRGVEATFKVTVEMDAKQAEELKAKEALALEKKKKQALEKETKAEEVVEEEVTTEE